MSLFVFGYFALLIAGSSLAAYYERRDVFRVLFTVTLASLVFGLIWGQTAFWAVTVIAILLAGAAGLGYSFRAYMVMLLPEKAERFMKSAQVTASFGLLVIIITLILAIFADAVAPYGEREIVGDV